MKFIYKCMPSWDCCTGDTSLLGIILHRKFHVQSDLLFKITALFFHFPLKHYFDERETLVLRFVQSQEICYAWTFHYEYATQACSFSQTLSHWCIVIGRFFPNGVPIFLLLVHWAIGHWECMLWIILGLQLLPNYNSAVDAYQIFTIHDGPFFGNSLVYIHVQCCRPNCCKGRLITHW